MLILEDDALPIEITKIELIMRHPQNFDFDIFLLGFRKNFSIFKRLHQFLWKLTFTLRLWKPRRDFDNFLFDSIASWKSQRAPINHNETKGIETYSSGYHYGTYAYIVNRRADIELQKHLQSLQLRSDEAISWLNMAMRLKVITPEFPLVSVDTQHASNIRSSKSQQQSFNLHGT
jgi:hypothetical protein